MFSLVFFSLNKTPVSSMFFGAHPVFAKIWLAVEVFISSADSVGMESNGVGKVGTSHCSRRLGEGEIFR